MASRPRPILHPDPVSIDEAVEVLWSAKRPLVISGRGAKGDRVRSEILKRQQPFSISEIEQACPGISRDMVRVVLRAMKAEGVIVPTGKGRGAKWTLVHVQEKT